MVQKGKKNPKSELTIWEWNNDQLLLSDYSIVHKQNLSDLESISNRYKILTRKITAIILNKGKDYEKIDQIRKLLVEEYEDNKWADDTKR